VCHHTGIYHGTRRGNLGIVKHRSKVRRKPEFWPRKYPLTPY
jgi:hypothetical protein